MTLAGFSEQDAPPLAIGYYLGLRWFQAVLVTHDRFSVTWDRDGQLAMICGCGATAHAGTLGGLETWYDAHRASSTVVLNGARARWEPGVNLATCGFNCGHRVPARECGCGFWSYWRLGDQQVGAPHIPALIKGTGKIIKGPVGFRCSQAEILALVVPYGTAPANYTSGNLSDEGTLLALALEETYAPVYSSVEALLEDYTAPDGQPPLGDDWHNRQISLGYPGGWVTASPGTTTTFTPSAGTGYAVIGGSGSNVTVTAWGAGGAGGGGGGGSFTVSSALRAGLVPCAGCSRSSCTPGQVYCVACLDRRRLSGLINTASQTPITGVDALNQLQARRRKWSIRTPGPAVMPPDPETSPHLMRTGRGRYAYWVRDYIKCMFSRA